MKVNLLNCETLGRFVFRNVNIKTVATVAGVVVALFIGHTYYTAHYLSQQSLPVSLAPNVDQHADHLSRTQPSSERSSSFQSKLGILDNRLQDLDTRIKKYSEVKFLSYKDRKRILVTGGAGFIGSHLVDALMLMGHEITVVDNFFTGRKRNIEHWIGHENFELITHDIVTPLHLEIDEIYHLAAPAAPFHYLHNPIKTIKTNTVGTAHILGLAKRVRAKMLLASTAEIYGEPEVHPQTEEYWGRVDPNGPRACHDEGKRISETLSYAYEKQGGLHVRVARIYSTFGPRMHMNDGRVVSNLILQALRNEPLTVDDSGSQTRSFQYVSDLVSGLIALMNSNYSRPINLGNPQEYTINELAQMIKQLAGGDSEIVHKPAVERYPQHRQPDITKAKNILNWQPIVSVEDGITRTIEYFREELEHQYRSERKQLSLLRT